MADGTDGTDGTLEPTREPTEMPSQTYQHVGIGLADVSNEAPNEVNAELPSELAELAELAEPDADDAITQPVPLVGDGGDWRGSGSQAGGKRRRRRRLFAGVTLLFVVLLLLTGAQAVLGVLDATAHLRDAQVQLKAMEAEVHGHLPRTLDALAQVRPHLAALHYDLQRIQADIPAADQIAMLPLASTGIHALRMADDLSGAALAGLDGVILALPHALGALNSLDRIAPGTAPGSQTTQPLTLTQTNQLSADFSTALNLFASGMHERQQVSESDLRHLGLGSLTHYLHTLDSVAALILPYRGDLLTVLHELPTLLGVTHPAQYLLLDLDSDELRPTGGFQGNYANLSLSGGQFQSGLQLHDIYTIDCLHGCQPRPIPSQFNWFQLAPKAFALRDANLNPDYPSTARLDEQLYQAEGGGATDGIISVTPQFIEQVLAITGPIQLGLTNTTVTAANLTDTLHYAHILGTFNPYAFLDVGEFLGTSDRKVADPVLGHLLAHAVAHLPFDKQLSVLALLVPALKSHALQVYVNDVPTEALLAARHLDGAVRAPAGDSLFVVDTNAGGTYANADVAEQATDTVTLDATGTATHDLTLAYTYRNVTHSFDQLLTEYHQQRMWFYTDVVRVIVPSQAHLLAMQGCTPLQAQQPGHSVWACRFEIARGQAATLHLRWSVPQATHTVGNATTYPLFLQRQAGTQDSFAIHITPPAGARFTSSQVASLSGPASSATSATYTATPTQDQPLAVTYTLR